MKKDRRETEEDVEDVEDVEEDEAVEQKQRDGCDVKCAARRFSVKFPTNRNSSGILRLRPSLCVFVPVWTLRRQIRRHRMNKNVLGRVSMPRCQR